MGNAVAKRPTTTLKRMPPIAEVVEQIKGHLESSAYHEGFAEGQRLQAGQKLLSLRHRIEAGEEGDVAWWDWYDKRDIGRSRKDAERLMRIASAENPEQALEDDNAKARERMRNPETFDEWLDHSAPLAQLRSAGAREPFAQ